MVKIPKYLQSVNTIIAICEVKAFGWLYFEDMAFLAFMAQGDVRPIIQEKLKAGDESAVSCSNDKDASLHNIITNIDFFFFFCTYISLWVHHAQFGSRHIRYNVLYSHDRREDP